VNDSVSTAFSLKRDKQLNEAIKYLSDTQLYKKAISAPPKQKKNAAKPKK
jgi:carboxyl-terminal processing protease